MKHQIPTKRILSLLLCLAMLLTCVPLLRIPVEAVSDTGGISTHLSDFGFEGKTISILGDSISTFENYSSGTAADTTNSTIRDNYVYYYKSTVEKYGVDVADTWWQQTADVLGMRVLVNNSWSGSRVINFGSGTVSAYINRSQQLHDDTGSNAGEKPDIIAIYMGTNDMKNADDPGDINAVDFNALKSVSSSYTPSTVFEAYALMLYRAIKKYPDAEIYCMTLIPYENITAEQKATMLEFNAGVKKIAQHYGVYVADLYGESGLTSQSECFDYHMANRLHPGPYGMDAISNCLINSMLENSKYNTSGETLIPITYDLDGVYVKGGTIQNALKDKPIRLSFGTREGYNLDLTVTMGSEDITESCYKDGTLTIDKVTGPLSISSTGRLQYQTPEEFRWEMSSNHMLSVNDNGAVYNGATLVAGSCTGSVFTDAQYSLEKPVILFHERPWIIEWKTTGTFTGGMLMLSGNQNGKVEGNTYVFRRGGSSLMAIGYSDGSNYYNYGLDLSTHSIDATLSHTYRLVNHINEDGSNMVYLYVDNKKLGAMNNYYIGTSNQNTTSDWLNGRDLVFNNMGTDGHPLNDGTIHYIQVWENGPPTDTEQKNFRWEPQNGAFTSMTTGTFAHNPLQQQTGTISTAGQFSNSYFTPEENIVLLHDQPWSIQWSSSGTWKDTANGAMLLSASDMANAPNGAYLYRRNESYLIALGERTATGHQNYGICLSDHGIDGTAQHTYRLTNRVNPNGTNMVYLYVDGVELGAMNNHFIGGTAQGTTSNWVSGRDFTFCFLGTPQFPIGNCYLDYLQVWERGLEPNHYRWEMESNKLVSISSEEFTQNNLVTLAGSISSGKLSESRFRLSEPVTLRHDRTWSMEWKSSGNWKETTNGALLFSTNPTSTVDGTIYLYRRNASNFIALGVRSGGKHLNYGVNLSDHGIDGSAEHVYRLTNRVAKDGTNMVYLYVDGVELGAMNHHFIGGTAQDTTSNWVSGQDFVFTYMGTTDFPIGNCNLEYLQIWEEQDQSHTYRWETRSDVLTSITTEGFTENKATIQTGSISGGTYTDSYFKLDQTVVLLHNKPWSMEWESQGSWTNGSGGALLFTTDPVSGTEGNVFLYRRKNSTLMGLGTYTGGTYHNYGLTLSDYGVDGTARHIYRLTNRLFGDGSNMVYLYVDGVELGPMNGYYLGGAAQGTTSNWLSGQDLSFSYFGTEGHTVNSCNLYYIQIWEDGKPGSNYRWETQNDTLVDLTTQDFTANEATQLAGTIADGTYTGTRFQLEKTVSLRHDVPWAIRWQSEGTWQDNQNGALLMSSHGEKTDGMTYIYRRNASDFIAFGTCQNGTYVNYGIKLSNYGIDGTASHEYLLANRVGDDGSNMVYLFVDGQEVGPLNNYFYGGYETFNKSNWISGRDFSFSWLGTTPFTIGNCNLDYLQVWEEGAPASTVTFRNWDGTVLETANYLYGQKVTAPETVPTREADETASYTFAGWSPEVMACGGDQVYTAVYVPAYIDYDVFFRDHDGTTLATATYHYGDTILAPADPVRAADETYAYTFAGWDQNVGTCTGDMVFTATYTMSYVDYRVQFLDYDGTVLSSTVYHYGQTPVAPADPDRVTDAQYHYTFSGWSPAITSVTGDAVYTATYSSAVNEYTITFLNEDGTLLQRTLVPYGELPTAPAAPTREADAQYTYTFAGWDSELTAVTGDKTYRAVYTSAVNLYTVTFLNEDGTVLSQAQLPYGETPISPATPGKNADRWYSYTFSGWSPAIKAVTGDVDYTARYTSIAHSYNPVVTAPDCTEGGYTTYTCTVCGYCYTADTVPAAGHHYEAVITPPTCTEEGYTTYTCSVCEETYIADGVAPKGHSYESVTTAPTCTEVGRTTHTCTDCGNSYTDNEIAALGHRYEGVTTAPTCTTAGYTTYTCTVCHNTYTGNETGAMGHQFETVITAPTCTEAGYTTYSCTLCAYGYVSDHTAASGHSYESAVTQPTCTNVGYTVYTCASCQHSYIGNQVSALGHRYETVTIDPTCSSTGSVTDQCIVCDHTVVRTLPAISHSYTSVVTPPACTRMGYTTHTCTVCAFSYVDSVIAATGHRYETVMIPASCTEGGFTSHTCITCRYSYTDEVTEATGHSYEVTVTAPTCEAEGFSVYTCSVCSYGYTADLTNATGHSYADGKCTACGEKDPDAMEVVAPTISLKYPTLVFEDEILMNVYFSATGLDSVTEMGLITYSREVTQWDVQTAQTVVPGYTWSAVDGYYYATTEGIAAKCLGDTIYFAVYARLMDGSYFYTSLVSYSPRTYAYNQLVSGSEEMKPLVVAMLNYGAAAQNYFGYHTDALVNSGLTAAQLELVEDYRADMMLSVTQPDASRLGQMVSNGGYHRCYPTISFEGAFCINYYFLPSGVPAGDITMYLWTQADYNAAATLNRDNATQIITMTLTDSGEYLAVAEGIAAKDLDQGVYVSFCYSDGVTEYCSGVIGYSIGTYCVTQAAKTGTLAELAAATAVYGYYAKELFYSKA